MAGSQVEYAAALTWARQQGWRRDNELEQVLGPHQHREWLRDVQAEGGQKGGCRGRQLPSPWESSHPVGGPRVQKAPNQGKEQRERKQFLIAVGGV